MNRSKLLVWSRCLQLTGPSLEGMIGEIPKSRGTTLLFFINWLQLMMVNLILHRAWPHRLSVLHLRTVQRGNRGFQGLFPAYYLIMMNEQPLKWQLFGCFVCSEASICNFPQKMSIWLWEQGSKLLLNSFT